jgi:glycosyltransferase involved in cell wall biosynthesis
MAIRVCINSQTPPIRPLARPGEGSEAPTVWRHGVDYTFPAGGLVPMMRALLHSGLSGGWIARDPTWVALGAPGIPRRVVLDEGFTVETVELEARDRAGYTRFKEAIWRSFHGPRGFRPSLNDQSAFVRYSAASALGLLPHVRDTDLFYVNDFQQVLVGGLIGASAPALLRWHIPLDFRGYPEPVRRFFLKSMEGFDGIVVSTRASLEDLIGAGYQGQAFQVYPYFDPANFHASTASAQAELKDRFHLGDGPVVLCVGRMDPVKRQDLAIAAMAKVRRSFPELKLLIVGGQSFTTQSLGSRKGSAWRLHLEKTVRRYRLSDRVAFTDTISPTLLNAAYDACDVFLHPAPYEGFGLVALEAWTHRRPVVVSRGAGCSELVEDGLNGFVTGPGSIPEIARRVEELLRHPEAATRMGEAGRLTARRCEVDRTAPHLREIFRRTIAAFGGPRGRRRGRGRR